MNISHITKSVAFAAALAALAASQTTVGNESGNSSATAMVVNKMAQASMVSGDYEAIGKAVGAAFHKSNCA